MSRENYTGASASSLSSQFYNYCNQHRQQSQQHHQRQSPHRHQQQPLPHQSVHHYQQQLHHHQQQLHQQSPSHSSSSISNAGNYSMGHSSQNWNNWNPNHQQYGRSYGSSGGGGSNALTSYHPQMSYRNGNDNVRSRPYYNNRYGTGNNTWQHNYGGYRRNRYEPSNGMEPQLKTSRKKKKPLSQNVPNKKEWTLDQSKEALATEREYSKKCKTSLIIKFPDLELNKDIVSQLHDSIDSVHFQQPSTPRFCFVTLKDTMEADAVIAELNQCRFGHGYLTAEYKKDRDDDQTVDPKDVDPLTLYVGNLAQEITKDDMINLYPISKRIDIGFAKKMKYTRYAFVAFRNVKDALDAFKETHNQQLYNKSLIVRFRRVHGTVGMPGESKPQNPPRNKEDRMVRKTNRNAPAETVTSSSPETKTSDSAVSSTTTQIKTEPQPVLEHVKQEQISPENSDDEDTGKPIVREFDIPEYVDYGDYGVSRYQRDRDYGNRQRGVNIKTEVKSENGVKNEPYDSTEDNDWPSYSGDCDEVGEDCNSVPAHPMDFNGIYADMVNHASQVNNLKNKNNKG